ncbi:hypothetical protein GCM10010124_37610 [Pilimelia terevasa]|uniref:Uncharacterized protein n=1 Tax=Pilimelia terevasa TaxID=53372 RepID=A0A8J3BUS9_9ACTN|nr:hypothetical protein [Pilimelia terevasa]GGK41241.1 hypothetical protein GCM10010124_37610 [Pilimelia terevasa]
MSVALLALCGFFGGVAVPAVEASTRYRRTGHWPWQDRELVTPRGYLVAVLLQALVGAGLAALLATLNPVPIALAIGVSAQQILQRLARLGTVADLPPGAAATTRRPLPRRRPATDTATVIPDPHRDAPADPVHPPQTERTGG